MSECQVNEICKDHFERIDKRLEDGDKELKANEKAIAVTDAKFDNLRSNVNALAFASWGLCSALIIALVYFVLNKI